MAKSEKQGHVLKAKTEGQHEYIRAVAENDVVFCDGPAGTGKSFIAVGLAAQYLTQNTVESVVFSRSIITCGNELGFFPGDLREKIDPYFAQLTEYFDYFIGRQAFERYYREEKIKFYPTEIIRGHSYRNAFMVLEEAQNCNPKQLKLFLSRMGVGSKVLVIGDNKQSDIRHNGFEWCTTHLKNLHKTAAVKLTRKDIMRHPVIAHLIAVFEEHGI